MRVYRSVVRLAAAVFLARLHQPCEVPTTARPHEEGSSYPVSVKREVEISGSGVNPPEPPESNTAPQLALNPGALHHDNTRMTKIAQKWIATNARYHDRVAGQYQFLHSEIYNPIEQDRLAQAVEKAVVRLRDGASAVFALDVGAGAGNLTAHLLRAGCRVTAADVSSKCLDQVRANFSTAGPRLRTQLLNGSDLRNWADGEFDLCGAYSVLHHVPDYLSLVAEMARVVRPGGIVFIDHESSEAAWQPSAAGVEYLRKFRQANLPSFRSRWGPSAFWKRTITKIRKLQNPRYQEEGDIHIWPDDHIVWDKVEECLLENGIEQIRRENYLVCRERDPRAPLYHEYRDQFADMSLLVALKSG